MGKSNIEWTDVTWSPVTGCTKISPGCKNCYAERMSNRLRGRCGYPADDPFKVTLHPDRLEQPLHWKKPQRVFVCSMGDLFHKDVDFRFIASIFGIIATCPQHIFIVLTKRPEIMQSFFEWINNFDGRIAFQHPSNQLRACCDATHHYLGTPYNNTLFPRHELSWPLSNLWLGISAENQEMFDERWAVLRQIPAAIKFVSLEPLLSNIDLKMGVCNHCQKGGQQFHITHPCEVCGRIGGENPNWVICGGESGPGARPLHPDWARSVRDQCVEAGVPFFFKQWGEWLPELQIEDGKRPLVRDWHKWGVLDITGQYFPSTTPWNGKQGKYSDTSEYVVYKGGKKAAGNLLDGKIYNQFPDAEKDKG